MRGLMAKPSGEIIERPIISNFREGLTVLEYFISTHGARKGLADTALKTADSGYLTRKLVDVAQDVIINEEDCGTVNGIVVQPDLRRRRRSRGASRPASSAASAAKTIKDPVTGTDRSLEAEPADRRSDGQRASRRSASSSSRSARCSPANPSAASARIATAAIWPPASWSSFGEAVGIIAAQSIGEPGTQLTMRTFHIGGTAVADLQAAASSRRRTTAQSRFNDLRACKTSKGSWIVLNKNGSITIHAKDGRELERYHDRHRLRHFRRRRRAR